jgi:uncharacterized protein (DUF433 family)
MPFETASGRQVPALRHPRPHLQVHPQILGGYPVIAGSRVPFHVVAGLASEGADAARIAAIYPATTPEAVLDATDFARQVAAVA